MPTIGLEGPSSKTLRCNHLFNLMLSTLHLLSGLTVLFSVHETRMPRSSVHF